MSYSVPGQGLDHVWSHELGHTMPHRLGLTWPKGLCAEQAENLTVQCKENDHTTFMAMFRKNYKDRVVQ
ncbi:hypothetical protein BHE74_00058704 [Ensete ventricosum]|nr:hypothetical protein GW17_00012522 [Ensete ventricosum]RWW36284.1 hypothetical protein BHE74_00058704 [Ensete ventricosum]